MSWHIFHEWSNWVTTDRGYALPLFNKQPGTYSYVCITQQRSCAKCGKIELRTVNSI